jgi:AraC-like DNA-binding protein
MSIQGVIMNIPTLLKNAPLYDEGPAAASACPGLDGDNHGWLLSRLHLRHVAMNRPKVPEGPDIVPGREQVVEAKLEVLLLLSGSIRTCIISHGRHEHWNLSSGQCQVRYVPAGSRLLDAVDGYPAEYLVISVSAKDPADRSMLRRLFESGERDDCPAVFKAPLSDEIMRTIERSGMVGAGNPIDGLMALSGALEVLWRILRGCETRKRPSDRCVIAIMDILRYMESRLEDPPSLAELADRAGMSVSKFKQVFSKNCGKPPYAYIRELRLDRAMCLLRHDGIQVTAAALEVGYSNFSHFAKVFEERFGIKPSQVRHAATLIC